MMLGVMADPVCCCVHLPSDRMCWDVDEYGTFLLVNVLNVLGNERVPVMYNVHVLYALIGCAG